MKTIVINKMFYVRPSTRADGMFDVWKNNGADAPDQLVGDPFATPGDADAFARKLEAKAKAAASDNRSMNNATDILLGYLADNPEITKGLLDKAIKHAAEKQRRAQKIRRLNETCHQADAMRREIEATQAEINKLRGQVLSLQKARKALVREAVGLSEELRALGAL